MRSHVPSTVVVSAAVFALSLAHGSLAGPRAALGDEPAAPRLVQRIQIATDFIDDPFALSSDGSKLAWITTDAATHSAIHVASVGDAKSDKSFPYGSITPERLEFLDGERVLVVERNPLTRLAQAEVFGPKGSLGKFGPATDVGLATVGGAPAIVTWLKLSATGKPTSHTFAAWQRDSLKPIARKVLVENSEGRVSFAGAPYKPLFFVDGYATMVGQKEGAYDKAKDIRKPDVAARADIFSGKILEEKEIPDVKAFAEFTNLRSRHNNESNFLHVSDDRARLLLVDASDGSAEVAVPMPFLRYDPESLTYRPAPGGNLTVSLTVNPVNAEAVKAQKADKDWLDLYQLDVKARTLTLLARIDREKRPTEWSRVGSRLALLHKHKGFGRGGPTLDILDLGPAAGEAPKATAAAEPVAK